MDVGSVLKVKIEISDEQKARQERYRNRPPLSEILSLHDFEVTFVSLGITTTQTDCGGIWIGYWKTCDGRESLGVLQLCL